MAFDHASITGSGVRRLRAKLSYTNLGFALAPAVFTASELQSVYRAALGHDVSATNLKRILLRRRQIVADRNRLASRAARVGDQPPSTGSGPARSR